MFRLPTCTDLSHVLQAAVAVDAAVGGAIQRLVDHGRRLEPLEDRGLPLTYFRDHESRTGHVATASAQALAERRRIVIRDVDSDDAFAPLRPIAYEAGYCAVQATPLIDAEFRVMGVLATYFGDPHHPGPASLNELDDCARIATLVVEVDALHEAIVDADRRLSVRARVLPAPVADAAGAARRLLPTLSQPRHAAAARSVIANLDTVARHLRSILHQSAGAGVREM